MPVRTRSLALARACALPVALCAAGGVLAFDGAPGAVDAFDIVPGTTRIEIGTETVGDRVDYEPHRDAGGFEPIESRQRYRAAFLSLEAAPTPELVLSGELWHREITSRRDIYAVHSLELGFRYRLRAPLVQRRRVTDAIVSLSDRPSKSVLQRQRAWLDSLGLTAYGSIASNFSDSIDKNSWTHYEDVLVKQASFRSPRDLRAQAGLVATLRIAERIRLAAYAGAGLSLSEFEQFDGRLVQDGCDYAFDVSEAGGQVALSEPCGDLLTASQSFASGAAFTDEYDVDLEHDLAGTARFAGFGLQAIRSSERLDLGIGYHNQRFARGKSAARMRERGIKPINENHSVAAWMDWRLGPRLTVSGAFEYSLHPLINRLQMLYTGFTSERFEQDAASVRLGVSYRLD